MKKKKKYYNKNDFLKNFIDVVNKHKNNLPKFNKCNYYEQQQINTNSWFDITKSINKTKRVPAVLSTDKLDKNEYHLISF